MWVCAGKCHETRKEEFRLRREVPLEGKRICFYDAGDSELRNPMDQRDVLHVDNTVDRRVWCALCGEQVYWVPQGVKDNKEERLEGKTPDDGLRAQTPDDRLRAQTPDEGIRAQTSKDATVDIIWMCGCGNWGFSFDTTRRKFQGQSIVYKKCGCGPSDVSWQVLNAEVSKRTRTSIDEERMEMEMVP